MNTLRIIGIDPGLNNTGWGIIDTLPNKAYFVAAGIIHSNPTAILSERLSELHLGIIDIIKEFHPQEASVEETFVNNNPRSTLKLGQARGAVILAPTLCNLEVFEYTPTQIKKMIVGTGRADKTQVDMMIRTMLQGLDTIPLGKDASDALGIALCHFYMRNSFIRKLQ